MKPKQPLKTHKTGTCIDCNKENTLLTAGRCAGYPYCYQKHRNEVSAQRKQERGITTETKPNKPINKISDKQAKLNAAYTVLRKQFLKDNPYCKACLPGCTFIATEVHHKKGRGEFMLDTSTWLPSCHNDHVWIELDPVEAKILGLSEDRL